MNRLQVATFPPIGRGEQTAAAPGAFQPGEMQRIRNGLLEGPGTIVQQSDFLLADTCMNLEGTPTEAHAVCGIFPFQVQGGAASPSAGIVFSFDTVTNKVYLHQLDESNVILRTFVAYSTYSETEPPFMTGFEMFNKFYFCDYTFNDASVRKGMGVFDPTGAGSISVPTHDLGGAGAATLRFKGISKHRGGTILGWGYDDDSVPEAPAIIRMSKYTTPDTWIPDTTEISAFRVPVGTIGVGIISCAMSGQYSIIGKQSEVFALDGDFSSQFYIRQISDAHGPVSVVGMVSIGPAAAWMSETGPVVSSQGGQPKLIGTDKVTRRFLNYLDLNSSWAVHDSTRQRVVWAMRRNLDDDGNQLTAVDKTELLIWDYARNAFTVSGTPKTIFCVGVTRGPGIDLAGPSGVVSSIAAANIRSNGAKITWTAGDTTPDVTFIVQYREDGTLTWLEMGTPGTPELTVTNLLPSTGYDIRIAQVRNSQQSAFVESASPLFTTTSEGTVATPTTVTVDEWSSYWDQLKNIHYGFAEIHWDPYQADPTVKMVLYNSVGAGGSDFALAREISRVDPALGRYADNDDHARGDQVWYWAQMENEAGTTSTEVLATPNPLTFVAGIPIA